MQITPIRFAGTASQTTPLTPSLELSQGLWKRPDAQVPTLLRTYSGSNTPPHIKEASSSSPDVVQITSALEQLTTTQAKQHSIGQLSDAHNSKVSIYSDGGFSIFEEPCGAEIKLKSHPDPEKIVVHYTLFSNPFISGLKEYPLRHKNRHYGPHHPQLDFDEFNEAQWKTSQGKATWPTDSVNANEFVNVPAFQQRRKESRDLRNWLNASPAIRQKFRTLRDVIKRNAIPEPGMESWPQKTDMSEEQRNRFHSSASRLAARIVGNKRMPDLMQKAIKA